jgi:flagellar motor switch protein FliN/FliY
MAESDLDKDLAGLMNDIGGGDAPDAGGGGLDLDADLAGLGGDSAAAPAAGGGGGGDELSLDPDLQSMMNDAGSPDAGGGDTSMGDMSLGGADMGGSGSGGMAASGGGRAPSAGGGTGPNLDFLLDIKLNVTFEVGRAKMLISDLLTLGQGSVIELHRLVGDELDLLVNGKLVAKGEVVVINEKFGCKIANIIPPEDRIRHMGGF